MMVSMRYAMRRCDAMYVLMCKIWYANRSHKNRISSFFLSFLERINIKILSEKSVTIVIREMTYIYFIVLLLIFNVLEINCQTNTGNCVTTCNSMKRDHLTLDMCRDAKKVLPRPKVGDFCSHAV